MKSLRMLSPIINFSVILFIGLKTLNSECFNVIDLNFSIMALIFSVFTELVTISFERMR